MLQCMMLTHGAYIASGMSAMSCGVSCGQSCSLPGCWGRPAQRDRLCSLRRILCPAVLVVTVLRMRALTAVGVFVRLVGLRICLAAEPGASTPPGAVLCHVAQMTAACVCLCVVMCMRVLVLVMVVCLRACTTSTNHLVVLLAATCSLLGPRE